MGRATDSTPARGGPNSRRVYLRVAGLGCGGGGALTIERALLRVEGVESAYVNPVTEIGYVEYDPARCVESELVAAVAEAGYRASTR